MLDACMKVIDVHKFCSLKVVCAKPFCVYWIIYSLFQGKHE